VTCSYIDFFLIRRSNIKIFLDFKVILGESLTTQHRVLVIDVRIKGVQREEAIRKLHKLNSGILRVKNKGFFNTISYREILVGHKEAQMICGTRWNMILEK